jgi:hypothetical protein
VRSEAYWEWLLARGACDRIYVAALGPEPSDLKDSLDSIVGYAFVRQCRIVELVTAPDRPHVAQHLVARVCADASEQNGWQVRCDAPPDHPLHELFHNAGGRLVCEQQLGDELFMAKLLDPLALLRQMTETLAARARAAGLPRPMQLGIELKSGNGRGTSGVVERYRLQLGSRSAGVETGGPSRHGIMLRYGDLAPLLLGDCTAEELLARGRLNATTRKARDAACGLFARTSWWRPPLDDLLA